MRNFTCVNDVNDINALVKTALELKENPYNHRQSGANKTLGLIFLNPSLRTRLSTQKAAMNLGMQVMVMNIDKEGWALEMQDGTVMDGSKVEHIREAAAVLGQYCDIIGIRSFPGLKDREEDYNEEILHKIISYTKVPVISMETATRHPLQSLADLVTISEFSISLNKPKPKVVLSWAPHVKPLPQAVPNSFSEWMCKANVDFVITHPEGYELSPQFTEGATITYNQHEALNDADFVYVKNWSCYEPYGQIKGNNHDWMLTNKKLYSSSNARIMHCLPVRRNIELSDELLNGQNSIVTQQAGNRVCAAQAVLKNILEDNF